MKVIIRKPEDEILRELFGPLQEAARRPYLFDLDPQATWCELAELRLSCLVCEFKPIGINRNFHLIAIHDRMNKIFDNEPPQSEIYLSNENKIAYRTQQKELLNGGHPERATYPPKYLCRPSLQMIEEKLEQWYGKQQCEENESYPASFVEPSVFTLPTSVEAEDPHKETQDEGSSSTEPAQLRKKKINNPEE